jgi:hypothetical protein
MAKSNFNLSPIYAAGFVGTYVDPKSPERERVVAELVYVFETAYGSGWSAGQRELAQKLLAIIGDRESLSAQELIALVSAFR